MKKRRICSGNTEKREPDDCRPRKKKEKTLDDLNLEKKNETEKTNLHNRTASAP